MSLSVTCVQCGKVVERLAFVPDRDLSWPDARIEVHCHGAIDTCVVDMTQLVAQCVVKAEAFRTELTNVQSKALPGWSVDDIRRYKDV